MSVLTVFRPRLAMSIHLASAPRSLMAITLMLVFTLVCQAQTYLNATGSPTWAAVSKTENGFVNMGNGNLHLEIPLQTFAQRGSMKLRAMLVYDSRVWQVINGGWQPTNVASSQGGWRFVTTADPGVVTQSLTSTVCNGTQVVQTWQNFTW